MRIGLLTTSFPRGPGDPSGLFVLGFAQALASLGHAVDVLSPAPAAAYPDAFAGRVPAETTRPQPADITLTHVRYASSPAHQQLFYGAGVPDNLAQRPTLAPQLAAFAVQLWRLSRCRARSWDAVVSHWALPCGLVASLLPGGLPHLAVCHSADVHALQWPGGRALRRILQTRANGLWFVSPAHRDAFLVAGAPHSARLHVGPMGHWPLPSLSRMNARQAAGLEHGRFTVLCMGRLVPIKGVDRAIATVLRNQAMDLVVAGDGPQRPALERLAAGHPRIRFVGTATGPLKQALLFGADALLVPSRVMPGGRSEGVPTVILEALQAGLPVVATRTGGVTGLLRDGETALLVPASDPDALAAALARLQRDPALRRTLTEVGRTLAGAHTWDALSPRIEQLMRPRR